MTRRDQDRLPPRPTVMGPVAPAKRAAKAPVEARAAQPDRPRTPTAMPGTAPARIALDEALLARAAPGVAEPVVAEARAILSKVIPAHLDDRATLFWGQDLQKTHRALLDERLKLLKSPLLRETPLHLSRLRDLLMRLDPETLAKPGGVMAASFRQLSRTVDTPEELAAARAEIEVLLRLLAEAGEGLATLRAQLVPQGERLAELGDRVEAMALAAAYLAETADPRFARSLRERRDSLRATAIQIRSGQMLHEGEADLPARLVLAIQNLALVALPAWLQNLALFEARLASGRPPSLTDARDLTFRLHDMLSLFPRTE